MRKLICYFLLLAALTASAQDVARMRNCRPRLSESEAHSSIRRAQRTDASTNPYIGNRRQLVVLVSFNDLSFSVADPVAQWQSVFNQQNYNVAPFHGSISDYFYDQSYGKLRLTFDLQRVALDQPHAKYCSTLTDDENSQYLVYDIVDVLRQRDINWSQYDWDGDGYVNQILILYAGWGQGCGGDEDTIWPHQWWLSKHIGGETKTMSYGGKDYIIDAYCCVQERALEDNESTFGTICHEYSHCFGLPDIYGNVSYVFDWDLMDYGNYNDAGYCPPGYSAHERMLVGWQQPTELVGDVQVSNMKATAEAAESYIVYNDGCRDEFYIIENRQQKGWDTCLPGSGLVIFHVDYDASIWENEYVNTPQRKRYTIFAANNRTTRYYSQYWAYPYNDNDNLTNTSTPAATLLNANTDGTMLMSKPITEMQVANGLASFHFVGPATGVSLPTISRQDELLYSFGRIDIMRDADGKVYKTVRKRAAEQ